MATTYREVMTVDKGTCSVEGCERPTEKRGWCGTHYQRWRIHGSVQADTPVAIVNDDERRFWSKVNKNGPVSKCRPDLGPCSVWLAGLNADGYGTFGTRARHHVLAHRYAYELLVGPIPEGFTLDHLCRNHACVDVTHVEPVTNVENVMRGDGFGPRNAAKTHCANGHPFDEANTYVTPDGWRHCRQCTRDNAYKRSGSTGPRRGPYRKRQ